MLPTRYASFFKRFIAHLVDVFLANLLTALLVIPVALMFVSGGILSRFLLLQPWDIVPGTDPEEILELIVEMIPVPFVVMWIVIFASLYWLYFAIFESSPRQATPGKMMLGIFVTDIYGRRISFLRALGRTLGKVLSKAFCYLGYILALFTDRSQALHDLLANTLVLEPDYIPAPPMVSHPPTGTAGQPAPASGIESGSVEQGQAGEKPE
jgi:uncharacterized RDD family membrane protein YckC